MFETRINKVNEFDRLGKADKVNESILTGSMLIDSMLIGPMEWMKLVLSEINQSAGAPRR